jgi:hypothetical protein
MTRVASYWGIVLGLPMAIYAPTHGEGCKLLDAIHLLNFAVTDLALNSLGDMSLVIKIGKFR